MGQPQFNVESLLISLENSIIEIQEDQSCDFIYDEIAAIGAQAQSLARYQQERFYQEENLKYGEYITLYTSYLNDPDFAAYEDLLVTSIFNWQTAAISNQTQVKYFSSYEDQSAAINSADTINKILMMLNSSSECFESNKDRLTKLLGSSLQLASYFASPATAVGLSVGGYLTESISRFFRDRRFVKSLRKIDETRLGEALTCVSEAFTTQYCQSQDNYKILDLPYDNETPGFHEFDGVNLIENNLNKDLRQWLRKVNAGGPITNSGNLVTKSKPIDQIDFVEKKFRNFLAISGEREEDVIKTANSGDTAAFQALFTKLIKDYSNIFVPDCMFNCPNNNGVNNPFEEAGINAKLLKFQIIEPSVTDLPNCNGLECDLNSWIAQVNNDDNPQNNITVDLALYKTCIERINRLVDDTLTRLRINKLNVVSKDPFVDLNSIDEPVFPNSRTARETLREISRIGNRVLSFLESLEENSEIQEWKKSTYRNWATEVRETTKLTNEILQMVATREDGVDLYLTEGCTLPEGFQGREEDLTRDEKATFIISCIIKLLYLDSEDVQWYFNRVQNIVSHELEAKKATGSFSNDIELLFTLSGKNILDSILGTYKADTPKYRIKRQISDAQDKLMDAYGVYYQTFSKRIYQALKDTESAEGRLDLCFYALSFPEESRDRTFSKIQSICENSIFTGSYKENQMSWKEVSQLSDSERMCSIYRFDQKELLLDNRQSNL